MTAGQQEAKEPHLPPAYRLVTLDSVDSTNDEAIALAEQGAEDGTLVWAKEQRKGKGRSGRSFVSPRGNLYFSLVLRPDCSLREAAQLGFVAALGVGDGIGSVAPPMIEVRYKWPNDVLFNDRKGAGILLESRSTAEGKLDWLVLGVGINVKSYPEDTTFPATSLKFEGSPPNLSEVEVLEAFSRHFMSWVDRWLNEGFVKIRKAWLAHAFALGEELEVRLPKETLRGRFRDLDPQGALLLDLPDGTQRTIAAGDIYPLT